MSDETKGLARKCSYINLLALSYKTHIYSSLWMQPSLTRSQSSRASLARRLRDGCIRRLYVHCRSCMALVLLKMRFFSTLCKKNSAKTCAHGCDYRQEKWNKFF